MRPSPAKRLRFTITKTTGAEPCIDELEVYTAGAGTEQYRARPAPARVARASSVFPNSDIHRLEHLNDGRYGNSRSWISNERGRGWVELEFPATTVAINRVVWGRDREQKFADRWPIEYRIEVATGSNDWRLVASSADRAAVSSPASKPASFNLPGCLRPRRPSAKKLVAERAETRGAHRRAEPAPMIYGGPVHAKIRRRRIACIAAIPMAPREVVEPGALGVVPMKFALPAARPARPPGIGEPLTHRRPATPPGLARWITDPANPLTARVMVNRIWQYHFGEGLVSTPSDFGANGARPTHPELLDWLAAEFIAHGWSVKALHRLIVNSATYRQSSAPRPEGLAVDAGSRLLWRFPPRRLEAEPIRDLILAVSGKLDLRMGGPGFSCSSRTTITCGSMRRERSSARPSGGGWSTRTVVRQRRTACSARSIVPTAARLRRSGPARRRRCRR